MTGLIIILIQSCSPNKGYMPQTKLTLTPSLLNIDSIVKKEKYTALILYCDNCGVGVSTLFEWKEIVKKTPFVNPIIIIKSSTPKLIETYLDLYDVPYSRIISNFDTLKTINKLTNNQNVILIDSTYSIIKIGSPIIDEKIKSFYFNLD